MDLSPVELEDIYNWTLEYAVAGFGDPGVLMSVMFPAHHVGLRGLGCRRQKAAQFRYWAPRDSSLLEGDDAGFAACQVRLVSKSDSGAVGCTKTISLSCGLMYPIAARRNGANGNDEPHGSYGAIFAPITSGIGSEV